MAKVNVTRENNTPVIEGTFDDLTNHIKKVSETYSQKDCDVQRKIKKAKLTALNYLEVDYEEKIEKPDESFRCTKHADCFWDVHNDLKLQLDRLIPHLALMCEFVDFTDLDDNFNHSSFHKFKVTGYVIGGKDEHEGVTIIGRKMLAGNRVLNLVTPFTKWEDEHNGYMYAFDLKSVIRDFENEVILYLDGKRAPSLQQELPFEESEKQIN